jgi:tetratricopeptide (TPR) repeat protein
MAKRIIIISSFPVCVVLAVIAIVFVGSVRSQNAEDGTNAQIGTGTEVDNLIADYNSNPDLASTLVQTAGDYVWNRKYDEAQRLYQAVSDKQAMDSWGLKARLGLARVNTLKLIGQKEYEEAYQRIDTLVTDFNREPELEVALFHIGQELFWQRQFGEAREIFDKAVEMFPDSSATREMKLWSAKTACCVLIYSRRATDAEIITAIDKMINDFADEAGLPWAVYWVSKEYEWTKGTSLSRVAWFNAPNSVYKQIMEKFSDTPYGQQAELDQKRLNHRMKIFNLMKEPNQEAIKIAIEEMVADLSFGSAQDGSEVAGELYWVACGLEERPDKEAMSKEVYERIVTDYPESKEADSAVLDIQRRVITDLLNAGEANEANVLMDEFIADYKEHPDAGSCLGRIAIGYYKKGYELKEANQPDAAKQHFEGAADTFERITANNLTLGNDAAYVYFYAGANYLELKRRENAIECLQKVADDWPGFEHACSALAAIGGSYERLRDEEGVPKEAVNSLIEEAYKRILANYPDCYAAKETAYRLAGMSEEKGDKAAAIGYYRFFLEKAETIKPSGGKNCPTSMRALRDGRIAAVKAKVAELEGFNRITTERLDTNAITGGVEGLTVEGGDNQ